MLPRREAILRMACGTFVPGLLGAKGTMVDDLDRIMLIVRDVGKIAEIQPDEDIFEAGFSSINVLQLLVELETALEVSIPDDQFIKARSPRELFAVVEQSRQEQAA